MKENVAGVYISYPFCAQKCTFCNFASRCVPARAGAALYRRAAPRDRSLRVSLAAETVYLGGGTPSDMDLGRPASAARAAFPAGRGRKRRSKPRPAASRGRRRAPGAPPASTASPSACSRSSRTEIARTGRKHTAEIVDDEVALLRERGIGNLNIDLIAGLSGQTEASWRESLDWIERLAPDARLGLHAGSGRRQPPGPRTAPGRRALRRAPMCRPTN